MKRKVFLATESDECFIGTVKDVLTEDDAPGAHTANSVIRGLVDEMIFGEFEYSEGVGMRVTIQIR